MPRNATRRQIVARAIQARSPRATGGTSAPRSAARGGTTGLGRGRVAPNPGRLGQARGFPAKAGGTPGAQGAPGTAPANVAPTPWSSKYEQVVAGARKSYLDTSGNFDLAEQTAKQDFGLDPGFNDYKANPNSRAALLEQTFQRNNRGTMNSAGLQLYSGSTSNRLGTNRSNYSANRDDLAKTYRDALGEINTGRAAAAAKKAEEEQQAYWDSISEAEGSEPEAAAAPAGKGKAKGKGKGKGKKAITKAAVAKARKAR